MKNRVIFLPWKKEELKISDIEYGFSRHALDAYLCPSIVVWAQKSITSDKISWYFSCCGRRCYLSEERAKQEADKYFRREDYRNLGWILLDTEDQVDKYKLLI